VAAFGVRDVTAIGENASEATVARCANSAVWLRPSGALGFASLDIIVPATVG